MPKRKIKKTTSTRKTKSVDRKSMLSIKTERSKLSPVVAPKMPFVEPKTRSKKGHRRMFWYVITFVAAVLIGLMLRKVFYG